MFNLPPIQSPKPIDVKLIPDVLKTWQIGQIFESKAKTSSNAEGKFLLQIGANVLDAKTKTPILAGEALKLQVTKLGHEPILKILSTPVKTDPITLYLRQAVPNTQSLQKLVNLINKVQHLLPTADGVEPNKITTTEAATKSPIKGLENSPNVELNKTLTTEPATKTLFKSIANNLTDSPAKVPTQNFDLKTLAKQIDTLVQTPIKASNISSATIQRFFQDSGINFENKVFINKEIPVKDLKLNLVQLKQTVDLVISNSQPQTIVKSPDLINTIAPEYRLPTLANYLLYSVPASEKAALIGFITQPSSFNAKLISQTSSFVFQAIQKLSPKQGDQLKQWIQFMPTLAEIRQLLEQSIGTITNHQLQALQVEAQADSALLILFNLLVAKDTDWIDLFNVRISKEEADDQEHWSVTIQLEMPDLGLIEAKLVMIDKQLHAGITSESNLTHSLINEHLHILQSALTIAGFDVATLTSKQDSVRSIDKGLPGQGPLLEDKA